MSPKSSEKNEKNVFFFKKYFFPKIILVHQSIFRSHPEPLKDDFSLDLVHLEDGQVDPLHSGPVYSDQAPTQMGI